MTAPGAGEWLFVTTPKGYTVAVPRGWLASPAHNSRGIVYQRPGAQGYSYSLRVMEPTTLYPEGYVVFHNSSGQPLDANGKVVSPATWHIPLNYQGIMPPPGWPPP